MLSPCPKVLWLRKGQPKGPSSIHREAFVLSNQGKAQALGQAGKNLRDLPWDDVDVVLIDASISRFQRLRILLAKRIFAPQSLAVLLLPQGAKQPNLSPFALIDHAFCETAPGETIEGDAQRQTALASGALSDPAVLAAKAAELFAAERKTVLWVDPNITEASPSMRHSLYSIPKLRQHGWTIRGWANVCEAASTEIEFLKIPTFPVLPGPLNVFHLYSFRPIAQAAFNLYKLIKGRRPAAIIHTIYLDTPDIASIHFHVGEWLRISKDLACLNYKEKLRRPLNLLTRRGERRMFSNRKISEFWPVSHSIGNLLTADGAPREKIHVLSNSYDATRFNPENRQTMRAPARRELGFEETAVVFAFAGFGNFGRKGLWLAIDAIVDLARRPGHEQVRLLIIGGTPSALQKVRAKIKALHGPEALQLFSFTGTTDRPEYYFAACDGFLFPSYFEACALVGVETSVMGVPLFVTPHHGNEMYLAPGENGELIEWDATAIADSLEEHIERGLERYKRVVGEVWTREEYAEEVTSRYQAFIETPTSTPAAQVIETLMP